MQRNSVLVGRVDGASEQDSGTFQFQKVPRLEQTCVRDAELKLPAPPELLARNCAVEHSGLNDARAERAEKIGSVCHDTDRQLHWFWPAVWTEPGDKCSLPAPVDARHVTEPLGFLAAVTARAQVEQGR